MKYNMAILFAGAFCAGVGVSWVTQQHRIKALEAKTETVRGELASANKTRTEVEERLAALRLEVEALAEALAAHETPDASVPLNSSEKTATTPDSTRVGPAAGASHEDESQAMADEEPREKRQRPDFLRRLGEMAADPEMREAIRARSKRRLDGRYGPLFERLDLTDKELDLLKELLVDRGMMGLESLNAGTAEQGREELSRTREQVDEAVRTLLGEEKYDIYRDYQATRAERGIVRELGEALEGTPSPLTEVQREQLVTVMLEARESSGTPSEDEQRDRWRAGVPSEEAIQEHLTQRRDLYDAFVEQSGEVLKEEQRETLQKQLEQKLKASEVGVRVMRAFMRSNADEDED